MISCLGTCFHRYAKEVTGIILALFVFLSSCGTISMVEKGKDFPMGGQTHKLDVEGHLLQVKLFLWKDRQPGGDKETPLKLTVQVKEETGGEIPKDVTIDLVTLEQNKEEQDIDPSMGYRRLPSYHEVNAESAIPWPIGSYVNARIKIRTPQGVRVFSMENVPIMLVE